LRNPLRTGKRARSRLLGDDAWVARPGPMPINVPNYNRKTDRHHFGTLIGITSES
jgi:hypothetical protein